MVGRAPESVRDWLEGEGVRVTHRKRGPGQRKHNAASALIDLLEIVRDAAINPSPETIEAGIGGDSAIARNDLDVAEALAELEKSHGSGK